MNHTVKLISFAAVTVLLSSVNLKPGFSKEPDKLRRVEAAQTKQSDEPATVLLEVEGVLEEGDAALSDGSLYDVFEFEGQAGQAITIRLESVEFDTYLLLTDAEGEHIAENDDVSASSTHSQLTIELTSDGTYRIFANSYDETGIGRYELIVTEVSQSEVRLGEADRFLQHGIQQFQLSEFHVAIQFWSLALTIYRESTIREAFPERSQLGEAVSLGNLGNAYFSLGQYERAIDSYQQTLEIARDIDDRQLVVSSFGSLGNSYDALGQYERAIDSYQQALEIARDIDDRQGEATSLNNLGFTFNSLNQYEHAINLFHQSLGIAREIGDRKGETNSLTGLGIAYHSLNQYERAIGFYQQSLEIAREIGDRKGETNSLTGLGIAYHSLDQYERAIGF